MSLFQYGFRPVSSTRDVTRGQQSNIVPQHLPAFEDCGLGRVEYERIVSTNIPDLSDPSPPAKKPRVPRGKYTFYTPENRAKIGKYALENGNERARRHFLLQFPNLNESTVRNFKKGYKEQLAYQKKRNNPQPITSKPKGRPPLLLELDEKLIGFIRAIRSKGGVINIHVVIEQQLRLSLLAIHPPLSISRTLVCLALGFNQSIIARVSRTGWEQLLDHQCQRDYIINAGLHICEI